MNESHEATAVREKTELGFWLYLMTDLMLFASLFATFFILRVGVADGPQASDIFSIDYVMAQTFVLLASSVTSGMALVSARFGKYRQMSLFLIGTIFLGATFLVLELREFSLLIGEGHSWSQSAFLSSYFTLVGTHGLHILIGLIWAITLLVVLLKSKKVSENHYRKLSLFTMFWHFLDLVWIFIFAVVYIIGVYA
jgi:cytochrome o ubiquinol oxidase subunit 3